MQVVQTLDPPPKSGSRALATMGWTPKSRAAARKTAMVNTRTKQGSGCRKGEDKDAVQ
jgi:hypothetical protein